MQKKVIISIIAVNVFIALMAFMLIDYSNRIESQFGMLNDNQIRMYNKGGFTTDEMEAVKLLDGVKAVTFNNRNIFPTYSISDSNGSLLNVSGITLEENNRYQKNLDYLAGSYLTDLYQVVITQSLADRLIANGIADDYEQLIGKEMVKGLKIVGVVADLPITETRVVDQYYTYEQGSSEAIDSYNIELYNSFLLFNAGREYDQTTELNKYNLDIYYDYQGKNRAESEKIVDNYNDSDPSNDGDSYSPIVNYEESVANGATSLIDPNSTAYGKTFNQFASIDTSGDRDQVATELSSIFPDAQIVTSDTTHKDISDQLIGDLTNTTITWIKFVIIAVGLELLILVPTLKNGKK